MPCQYFLQPLYSAITFGIGRFCSPYVVNVIIDRRTFEICVQLTRVIRHVLLRGTAVRRALGYLIRVYNGHTDEIWDRAIGKYYLASLERTFWRATDDKERATA